MSLRVIPPKHVGRYALLVEYGSSTPHFKTYNDLGHAKNAYYHRGRYNATRVCILERVDDDWYALYDFVPGSDQYSNRSDTPWKKDVEIRYGWRNHTTERRAVPMTRDEYADWRIRVERERVADLSK